MMNVNLALWAISLTLQCALLFLIVMRGVAHQTPAFSLLIAFYTVRSAVLYGLSSHLRGPSSVLLLSGLGIVDMLLQVVVAWELYSAAITSNKKLIPAFGEAQEDRNTAIRPPTRAVLFALLVILAAGIAFACAIYIHASPRAPIDRSVLFNSTLFLLVFLAFLGRQTPVLSRRFAEGFMLFACVAIICQISLANAGMHHNVAMFNRWSYVVAAAYVVVLMFWILTVPRQPKVNVMTQVLA